jgi:hypothetical protein
MINVSMTWSGRVQSVTEAQTAWKMLEQAVSGLPIATRTEIVILVEDDTIIDQAALSD